MVKVGFICEGDTEFYLLESEAFKQLLQSLNIFPVRVINARGSGNLLPHNIAGYINILENEETEVIVILTDLDDDACITQTKGRISARDQDIVIISVKKIEAWFLAETITLRQILGQPNFTFAFPENEANPFNTISSLLLEHTDRGVGKSNSTGAKIKLVKRMLDYGFSMQNASAHANCASVKYFVDKLAQIGNPI